MLGKYVPLSPNPWLQGQGPQEKEAALPADSCTLILMSQIETFQYLCISPERGEGVSKKLPPARSPQTPGVRPVVRAYVLSCAPWAGPLRLRAMVSASVWWGLSLGVAGLCSLSAH